MELRTVSADEPLEGDSEELVYAAAVLILSEDLYPRKLEIIREYIQNASDALDDFIRVAEYLQDRSEPQIKISIQGRSLLIFDNGIGMDEEEIAKLKRIAYSEKRMGEEAGYKGIGRLAGIAVANKLKISSTSYGDPKLYHFEFRARDMRQDISESKKRGVQESATKVINRHTEMWFTDIDPDEHYTLVELRDIHESHDELLEPEQLMEYIGDIAPVDFPPEEHFSFGPLITENLFVNVPDYSPKSIYLSGPGFDRQHIYKPYTNEMLLAKPEFKVIRNPDNPSDLLAYYWYAPKGQQILGKVRPVGRLFSIEGRSVKEKYRLARACLQVVWIYHRRSNAARENSLDDHAPARTLVYR
jgi:histidine kinase/DNA gyrase B/HSP90-like ATPase